jgi:hypothetical protein
MSRTNLFFKVEIEHEPSESPERIADQIRRQVIKIYGVQLVELSNVTAVED